MSEDRGFSEFVQDLKAEVENLEEETSLEEDVIKKQNDAEQKLTEALEEIRDDKTVWRAIIYFRKVDLSASPAEVHQQVEDILNEVPGSSTALEAKYGKVEGTVEEIEKAFEELQEAHREFEKAMEDEEATERDMEQLTELINGIQTGASKYRQWAKGRE